jgi:fatty-acyl-CoA synthase
MELRIVADGADLPERHVGEILLRGPSMMSGYMGEDTPDPFLGGGWLRTGDTGYMAGEQLYVTGRVKDMVISMGHNYYPEDFEWAAGRVEGVRPGRCVAFSMPDSEEVVVMVETRDGEASNQLSRQARRAIANAVGVRPSSVVVVPPGTVRKTTSGKLRRAAMRELYVNSELEGALLE